MSATPTPVIPTVGDVPPLVGDTAEIRAEREEDDDTDTDGDNHRRYHTDHGSLENPITSTNAELLGKAVWTANNISRPAQIALSHEQHF